MDILSKREGGITNLVIRKFSRFEKSVIKGLNKNSYFMCVCVRVREKLKNKY